MRKLEAKLWPFVFALVPILSVWLFVAAPGEATGKSWWFPEDVSTYGGDIDALFNIILAITGFMFVVTNAALVWFMWRYGHEDEGRRATFIHGSHNLEVFWTVIPAAVLLFIALFQMGTWKRVKFTKEFPNAPIHADVTAGQFEWRITYPGPDGKVGTRDDVHGVNKLVVPVETDIVIHLKSRDVLHSFFLPNLRLKQDAVPGMTIPVWFRARRAGEFELMCAELCGWGHYKMKGWLSVVSKPDFVKWLADEKAREEAERDDGKAFGDAGRPPGEKKPG